MLAIANREQRVLITNDRDFGDLVVRQHYPHVGVIYLRLPLDADASQTVRRFQELLDTHQADLGKFIVVSPYDVRVRTE